MTGEMQFKHHLMSIGENRFRIPLQLTQFNVLYSNVPLALIHAASLVPFLKSVFNFSLKDKRLDLGYSTRNTHFFKILLLFLERVKWGVFSCLFIFFPLPKIFYFFEEYLYNAKRQRIN